MRNVLEQSWVQACDGSAVIVDAEAYYRCLYEALVRAQHQVLIAGWQFDTQVALLRGEAAQAAAYPVQFLALLNALQEERPDLRIHVLAWDYSVIYSLEREWMQGFKFAFQASAGVQFEFDPHPHTGGSHHQKFAIIDDEVAFVGGLDICDHRWDNRGHREGDSLRVDTAGEHYRPNHEVQTLARGPVVQALRQEFVSRWQAKTRPALPPPSGGNAGLREFDFASLDPASVFPLESAEVAVLRTWPSPAPGQAGTFEVQQAYVAALGAAERLVYIETQYFTSRSLVATLLERLQDPTRSRLQIIVVLPLGADNSKEAFAIGDLQHHMLNELCKAAAEHGHELCLLCSRRAGNSCNETTFIHSKLLLVDDEFLGAGSANMTERSMGLDTELGLAWQGAADSQLSRGLRGLRASLLAEHSGLDAAQFDEIEGLIERIRAGIGTEPCRLIPCPVVPASPSPWKNAVFDPGGPNELSELALSFWASEDGDRLSRGNSELGAELLRQRQPPEEGEPSGRAG